MSENDGEGGAGDLRDEARALADAVQARFAGEGRHFDWFEALYEEALVKRGERRLVPWAEAAPRFRLQAWLAEHPGDGRRAIDIGCGLGDNARLLAEAGWQVSAFDLSETAIEWARKQPGAQAISYHVADLFALPAAWEGGFDLVHETYTLQAMPQSHVEKAIGHVARLVAPGGTVLVMCRARDAGEAAEGPPWPLCLDQLAPFAAAGLEQSLLEEFWDEGDPPIRHFLLEYRRPA